MKKYLLILILSFSFIFGLFGLEIPESLYGIWEGSDRLVFFDKNIETGEPELSIYIKSFYGWYIDRTAEPDSYAFKDYRPRNDATSRNAVSIITGFDRINKNVKPEPENENDQMEVRIPYAYDNAFEITLQYSKNQKNSIPIAVLNDKLYLNFFIQDINDPNLYRGNIASKGLMVSEQSVPDNIGLYYINSEKNLYYDIRYWKTDMDYEDSEVTWQKGDVQFNVDKHLISAGYNYSSVSGRSKKIRNPVDGFSFSDKAFTFSEDKSLLITDSKPYLYKLADHKTLEDLFQIVKEHNSKKKPAAPPPFSYSEMEWHKIIIKLLEEGDESVIYKLTEWQTDKKYREQVVNGKNF